MEKHIKEMYEKQKKGSIKGGVIAVITYFLMMGVVSIFMGNPLPHRKKVIFLNVTQPGWVTSDGYLLLVCAIVAVIVGIGSMGYNIMGQFRSIDSVLLLKCDAKTYLEFMECMVTYGKELKGKGLQKTMFLLAEQRYIVALIAKERFKEAKIYLTEKWVGKRNGRLYRQAVTQLELAVKYDNKDEKGFYETLKQARGVIAKNRLYTAKGLLLKNEYEAGIELLRKHEEKVPYYEGGRRFLMGKCYDGMGDKKQAANCMEYVVKHGNTLSYKAHAQEWIETWWQIHS